MATSRNDDKGYERGARGIDGRDGENFHPERYPSSGASVAVGKVTSSGGGASHAGRNTSPAAAQRSAKGK